MATLGPVLAYISSRPFSSKWQSLCDDALFVLDLTRLLANAFQTFFKTLRQATQHERHGGMAPRGNLCPVFSAMP